MTAQHRYLLAALVGGTLASCVLASCTLYTSHSDDPVDHLCGSGSNSCPDGGILPPDAPCSGSGCGGSGSCGSDGGYPLPDASVSFDGGCGLGGCYPDAAIIPADGP